MPFTTEPAGVTEADLRTYCRRYRPKDVPAAVWEPVAAAVEDLILRAGDNTFDRVKKDLQLLGEATRLLHQDHQAVDLEAVFTDAALVTFARHWSTKSPKSQENLRGRWRRLRDCHAGLPFRRDRKQDGDRVGTMQPVAVLGVVHELESKAAAEADRPGAEAFLRVLTAVRGRDGKDAAGVEGVWSAQLTATTWSRAREFAAEHGHPLTRADLRAAVVHEVLTEVAVPAAYLARQHGLTRRELDLALTHPAPETEVTRSLLRGP